MFARITCPACSHKFSVPEAAMGKRQNCPNCQSYFVAGTSEAEPRAAEPAAAGVAASAASINGSSAASSAASKAGSVSPSVPSSGKGYDKTMMADTAPPIKFTCPRCKKQIEVAASEAGTKLACPGCSQRVQAPAAPPVASASGPSAQINKTMLVDSGPPIRYNCPACKKPLEASASEALTKKPCPHCGQRHQVPAGASAFSAAPNPLNKTMLATETPVTASLASDAVQTGSPAARPASLASPAGNRNLLYVGGAVAALFLVIFLAAVVNGGKHDNSAALIAHQKEVERLKNDADKRQAELEKQKQFESDVRRQLEDFAKQIRLQREKAEDDHRDALRLITDAKLRQEQQEKFDIAQRRAENDNREREARQQKLLEETKARLEESKRALDAANQKRDTVIQQSPPPVVVYPPFHPRYYWWW